MKTIKLKLTEKQVFGARMHFTEEEKFILSYDHIINHADEDEHDIDSGIYKLLHELILLKYTKEEFEQALEMVIMKSNFETDFMYMNFFLKNGIVEIPEIYFHCLTIPGVDFKSIYRNRSFGFQGSPDQ